MTRKTRSLNDLSPVKFDVDVTNIHTPEAQACIRASIAEMSLEEVPNHKGVTPADAVKTMTGSLKHASLVAKALSNC